MEQTIKKYRYIFFTLWFWVLTPGCAHLRESQTSSEPEKYDGISDVIEVQGTGEQASISLSVKAHGQEIELENSLFDLPVVVNPKVEKWIEYFTGRGRKHFERYLERSEYFIPYIVPILKEKGLPEDLVYLAMIESGFNNHARSRARAVGPWQFISATGKRYGLSVNWWVDERRDVGKSTLAAVGYLKDLYELFGSWELAAAAYNAGESKVGRAIRRYRTNDFWELIKHRYLRPETRAYVPKMMAAAIVSKNRKLFGFPESYLVPHEGEALAADGEFVRLETEDVETQEPLALPTILLEEGDLSVSEKAAEWVEPSVEEVQDENAEVRVVASGASGPSPVAIATPHVSKEGKVGGERLAEFELRSPADLLLVGRAAGLSYQTVKRLNPEILRWCTPPSSGKFKLKLPESVKDRFLVTYNHPSFPREIQFRRHQVRRGETLSGIAKRYGLQVEPIQEMNGLRSSRQLKVGSWLVLPLPEDTSRSLAMLEVQDPQDHQIKSKKKRSASTSARRLRVSLSERRAARSPVASF